MGLSVKIGGVDAETSFHVVSRGGSARLRSGDIRSGDGLHVRAMRIVRRARRGQEAFYVAMRGRLNDFPIDASAMSALTLEIGVGSSHTGVAPIGASWNSRRGLRFRSRDGEIRALEIRPDGRFKAMVRLGELNMDQAPMPVWVGLRNADGVLADGMATLQMRKRSSQLSY